MATFQFITTTIPDSDESDRSESPEAPVVLAKQIQSLRDAIFHKQPVAFGTTSIPADQWTIFYGRKGHTNRIDLSDASETELEHLSNACQPATFGVNQDDILDESYRKAGKLDVTDFATKIVVADSRLMDVVRSELLEGHESNRTIKAELYKLNVYGKGSFFKSHKDTPRSSNMFGSLVIVFPTKHEGGALILRHDGGEWVFDSAKMIQTQTEPSIAYVIFYSDVEHEVTPVTFGTRVSLTYSLYFSGESSDNPLPPIVPSTTEVTFKTALATLLSDHTFMEKGGFLGFGLQYEYPLDTKAGIGNLINCLKGSDAIIQRVCNQLSLQTMLRVIYEEKDEDESPYFVMVKDVMDYSENGPVEMAIGRMMTQYEGGKRISITGPIADEAARYGYQDDYGSDDDDTDNEPEDEHIEVDWVTDLTKFTVAKTAYIAYGNEARMGFMYGNVCLLVHVGPSNNRTKIVKEPAKKKQRYY